MKRLIFVLLLAFAVSACVAQSNTEDAEKTVRDLEQQLFDRKDQVDRAFADKHIADDLIHQGPMGEDGKADYINPMPGQTVYELRIDNLKVRVFNDSAVAEGRWWKRTKIAEDGKIHEFDGFFQDVWVRRDGNWKLVASATSPLMHPEPKTQGSSQSSR